MIKLNYQSRKDKFKNNCKINKVSLTIYKKIHIILMRGFKILN